MPIFGGNDIFYDLFEKQAEFATNAAREFDALLEDMPRASVHALALKRIESDADTVKHDLDKEIEARFITPYDKEDIQALGGELDDIIDCIEAVSARVVLFRLESPHDELLAQGNGLKNAVDVVCTAVAGLRHLKDHRKFLDRLTRIHDIENTNDQAYRKALGVLFADTTSDPLTVMKWKEIFDRLEAAVDKCEDVAVTLERIAVKYA